MNLCETRLRTGRPEGQGGLREEDSGHRRPGLSGPQPDRSLCERKDASAIFDREDSPAIWSGSGGRCGLPSGGCQPSAEPGEFETGNAGLTGRFARFLREAGVHTMIVFSSSIQAALDNPYGASKRRRRILCGSSRGDGACVRIYRLKNLFGKWCRPNYNSVTATFCHNIANGVPIAVSDPGREVDLVCGRRCRVFS